MKKDKSIMPVVEGRNEFNISTKEVKKETKQVNQGGKHTMRAIKLMLMLLVVSGFGLMVYAFNLWSQYNKIVLQSPVVLRTPVYVERVNREVIHTVAGVEVVKPEHEVLTKEQIIQQADNAEIIHKINILEITRGQAPTGLHKYCEERDMSNEFGFDPFNSTCFRTFAESVKVVDSWFNDRWEEGFTLEQALCYYNTGYRVATCDYVTNYKGL